MASDTIMRRNGLGKSAPGAEQEPDATEGVPRPGLRLGTLLGLRWMSLTAQAVALAFAVAVLGYAAPIAPCLALIGLGVALNVVLGLSASPNRPAEPWPAALQLAFDVVQTSGFLYLTGGVANPFSLLLIAPPTLAAAALPGRQALTLTLLSLACAIALAYAYMPAPWRSGEVFAEPLAYRLGAAAAVVTGIVLSAGYAWRASREAKRMQLALDVTQSVLAREQRISALGGLAAAAAHELGTPLATISVVAKEMAREAPEALRDDVRLLLAQTERCREILRRLTAEPDTGDEMHERMSLTQVLGEILQPHQTAKVRVEALVTGQPGATPPDVRRMPEVLHAMTTLIDNAVDFAASEVLVTARFDAERLSLEVRDDGPGFPSEVLSRLGQPYVTSRKETRSGHAGMGLGFFIAKTLLERTGAVVSFSNGKPGGAVISAAWPRAAIEAPPLEI